MADGNYIFLNRSLMKWEWYQQEHTKNLFIHCLLKANWCDGKFKGNIIKRGSFVTSYNTLCNELDLTINEVRTAIRHLQTTHEITVKAHSKFSVITVVKYNDYQRDHTQKNENSTITSHSINTLLTTIEEYKEEKELNNKKIKESSRFAPPTVDEVKSYCSERNNKINADQFIDFYSANGWVQGKGRKPIKDWKATVRTWERRDKENGPAKKNYDFDNKQDYDFASIEQKLLGRK